MSELILSLNAGSSSLKFGLYRRDGGELVETMRGLADGLGGQARLSVRDAGGETLLEESWSAAGDAPEHASALARVLAWLDSHIEGEPIAIVAQPKQRVLPIWLRRQPISRISSPRCRPMSSRRGRPKRNVALRRKKRANWP